MNVKDMTQGQDNVRTNAIKRRMQQKKSPPVDQKNQDNEVVDERKNAGY